MVCGSPKEIEIWRFGLCRDQGPKVTSFSEKIQSCFEENEKKYVWWDNKQGTPIKSLCSFFLIQLPSVMRKNNTLVRSPGVPGPVPTVITFILAFMSPHQRNLCITNVGNMFGYYLSRVSPMTDQRLLLLVLHK